MRSLRVTMVCQWFPPEPAQQPLWIVEALERTDCDVSVLTGIPNYPDGVVHSGYSARRRYVEHSEARTVVRTPLYPSHDSSALSRILNYASWAVSATLSGARAFRDAEVTLVYSSPATSALPAMWRRHRDGTPYVLVIQDLWPDSIFASGFLTRPLAQRLVRPLVNAFVRATYRGASKVVVISPGMGARLASRGVPEHKLELVYNWVDEEIFHPRERGGDLRRQAGLDDDDFVVLYAGNHGAAQALGPVVDTFTRASDGTHLVMVGDGIEKASLVARAMGAYNVHFLDPMPQSQVGPLMADADALLVSLSGDALFEVTMPSKVQAALAVGRPLLVSAPGDAAAVVEAAGAGATCRPGDSLALQRAIGSLRGLSPDERNRMGKRAARLYDEAMSQAVSANRLGDVLRAVARQHGPAEREAWVVS